MTTTGTVGDLCNASEKPRRGGVTSSRLVTLAMHTGPRSLSMLINANGSGIVAGRVTSLCLVIKGYSSRYAHVLSPVAILWHAQLNFQVATCLPFLRGSVSAPPQSLLQKVLYLYTVNSQPVDCHDLSATSRVVRPSLTSHASAPGLHLRATVTLCDYSSWPRDLHGMDCGPHRSSMRHMRSGSQSSTVPLTSASSSRSAGSTRLFSPYAPYE
ncbi:hypothetical protein JB92DRAFT_2278398 [Gautieria morchelliformis]|nr:hypothetical protein JB92DRAFT_2278398 [Gautieria morchelliformis]